MTKVIELVIIFFEEDGYEVTYPNGYKSWSPAKEFEKAYYKLDENILSIIPYKDIAKDIFE